jgi:Xaa-Pro aminopeptidase
MFNLKAVQAALAEFHFDGWLLCDFRGSNVLARRILDLPTQQMTTRRWFYFVPVQGEPVKLVHRIETGALDHLPGAKRVYLRWQELSAEIAALVTGKRVAMEYSPQNAIPYLSKVDAGTVELVRSSGGTVVSSGDLVQLFEATWDDEQWAMHLAAAKQTDAAYEVAWKFIAREIHAHGQVRETAVQAEILRHFSAHGLTCDHPPIVAVGPHSADPHYEPSAAHDGLIRPGELVLVDLWAKLDQPRAVYSDLTRMGYVGSSVPNEYAAIFEIVAAARDAAIQRVQTGIAKGESLMGWQVDQACRAVIDAAGYGDYFVHRTGHSIGQETHGNGANIDNLETQDQRLILPRTCFSIEPGIYQPGKFGVRSEINVFIDAARQVHVTGGALQRSIVSIG